MVFPKNNYNIMNNHRNMYFYDEGENKSSKLNPEPAIYQCDNSQSIDILSLNPVDAFNPNLLCYIPERECNNDHKYDRLN